MPTYTSLKHIVNAKESLETNTIKENLIAFFNWSLLEAEGFSNVPVLTPGINDPYAEERLMFVQGQTLPNGKVWEAVKSNWVWETLTDLTEVNDPPVVASGVYVNGTYYPTATTTGQYTHKINFPEGRV